MKNNKQDQVYKETYTGKKVYIFNPTVESLDLADISHSLSMVCRFGGHTKKFYSVAEHCVILSNVVPEEHAKWALMHDASEAYFGDLIRPIKHTPALKGYREAEKNIQKVIAKKFGLPSEIPSIVKEFDSHLLYTEAKEMFMNFDLSYFDKKGYRHLTNVEFNYYSPNEAKKVFLSRFSELFEKIS